MEGRITPYASKSPNCSPGPSPPCDVARHRPADRLLHPAGPSGVSWIAEREQFKGRSVGVGLVLRDIMSHLPMYLKTCLAVDRF
jgi:hypothetical protein